MTDEQAEHLAEHLAEILNSNSSRALAVSRALAEQGERIILLLERINAIQDGSAIAYTGLPVGDGFPQARIIQGELPPLEPRKHKKR